MRYVLVCSRRVQRKCQTEIFISYSVVWLLQIAKERQMEFDTETDPDTLYELFGEDYESFAE